MLSPAFHRSKVRLLPWSMIWNSVECSYWDALIYYWPLTINHSVKFSREGPCRILKTCIFLVLWERTLMYKFTIRHLPGKLNAAPDSASRYPIWIPSEGSTEITQISSAHTQQMHRLSAYKTTTTDAGKSTVLSRWHPRPHTRKTPHWGLLRRIALLL